MIIYVSPTLEFRLFFNFLLVVVIVMLALLAAFFVLLMILYYLYRTLLHFWRAAYIVLPQLIRTNFVESISLFFALY